MLEWLVTYLPREALDEPWFTRAVDSLLTKFDETSRQSVDCGSLYHGVHGLRLYYEKRFPAHWTTGDAVQVLPQPARR
jgi:hypothetical protein